MELHGDQVPVVFAMSGADRIAQGVDRWIDRHWLHGFRLAEKEERRRHDRESYIRSKINVRGRKVYILDSFATDADEAVDEKIWGTILFISKGTPQDLKTTISFSGLHRASSFQQV